jgi:septal ring-binding cell division protein DamX
VVGVIRSIAAWTDGSFTIVADYLPKRDEGTLFPLPQVLIELIVTEQDRARFERALDGGEAVFTKTPDFDQVWRRLGLNEDAEAIVVEIDGTKNAGEVAAASNRDTFNVYKLLHGLATLGVLTRSEKPKVEPQFALDDFAAAGVADAADLWNDPAPEPAITPQFELDETEAFAQPTLEIPTLSMSDYAVEPVPHQMADEAPLPNPPMWQSSNDTPFGDSAAAAPMNFESDADSGMNFDADPGSGMNFESDADAGMNFDPDADTAPDFEPHVEPQVGSATSANDIRPPAAMPAWDMPPRDALSVPIQTSVEPPVEPPAGPPVRSDEQTWGFDEAQIETARRADVPVTAGAAVGAATAATALPNEPRRRKSGGRYGFVVAMLAIALLAAAAYFGFMWWQEQQGSSETLVAQRPANRPQPGSAPLATTPPAMVVTETSTTTPAAATLTTTDAAAPSDTAAGTPASTTAATPTTTALAPAPAVITPPAAAPAPVQITAAAPAPVPPASTTAALPRVTARVPAGRERFDAMAREYAANPTGNFTVQIQILCDPANLEKAMRAGGENVWFVPQTISGRSCYRVFWGRYGSRADAQGALAQVPASLRDKNSAVKAVPR